MTRSIAIYFVFGTLSAADAGLAQMRSSPSSFSPLGMRGAQAMRDGPADSGAQGAGPRTDRSLLETRESIRALGMRGAQLNPPAGSTESERQGAQSMPHEREAAVPLQYSTVSTIISQYESVADAGQVTLVVVDTRAPEGDYKLTGSDPALDIATNIGAGWSWKSHIRWKNDTKTDYGTTKIMAALNFMDTTDLPDDHIVAFLDATDVVNVGCTDVDLRQRFEKFRTLGKRVVIGAELNCCGQPVGYNCETYPEPDRANVLSAFNLDVVGQQRAVNASLTDGCKKKYPGCGTRKYVNSGFYMGSVQDLQTMLAEVSNNMHNEPRAREIEGRNFGAADQPLFAQYFADHTDFVTLDYAGALVANLYGVSEQGAEQLYKQNTDGSFTDTSAGTAMCFAHGNGGDPSLHMFRRGNLKKSLLPAGQHEKDLKL